jgi:hypothetical protein
MFALRTVALCFLLLFTLAGCSSSYLVNDPLVLEPCHRENARELSTAALILALQGKHWLIEGADLEAGLVRARACRGSYCISIDGSVDEAGIVRIRRTPGQYVSGKGGRLLQHWMRHLTRAYHKYRCSEPRTLKAEMDHQKLPIYIPPEVPAS